MSYITRPEVTIEKAPASYWGTAAQNKIGFYYEFEPRWFRDTANQFVLFDKVEINFIEDDETFFVQRPTWVDKTASVINDQTGKHCYPPAFAGLEAAFVDEGTLILLKGNPIAFTLVAPFVTPSRKSNDINVNILDLNISIKFTVQTNDRYHCHAILPNGATLFLREFSARRTKTDDAIIVTITVGYFVIRSKGKVWVVLRVKWDNEEINQVIPQDFVYFQPNGDVTISFYGAARFYVATYNTNPLYLYPQPTFAPWLASPQVVTILDFCGNLQYLSSPYVMIPMSPTPNYPRIIRRMYAYGTPALTSGGTFTPVTGIISAEWSDDSGSLKGYDINLSGGETIKITVGDYTWLFRVKSIRQIISGEDNRVLVTVELYNPLFSSLHTTPLKLNPYLMRVGDLLSIMYASIHLNFSIVYPVNSNAVIYDNREVNFNSPTDWFDYLKELVSYDPENEDSLLDWWVVGNTVIFNSPVNPVSLEFPSDEFVFEKTIESSAEHPTVGIVCGRVIVSNEAASRGFTFRTGGFPVKRVERYRVAGVWLISTNAFVELPSKEIAQVKSISYSVSQDEIPRTEMEVEVLAI